MANGFTLRCLVIAMAALLGALALTHAASTAGGPPTAHAAAKRDKDCDDLRTQKKAQKFFRKHNPRSDPHYLDADNDRIACEDNRCPCTRKWHQQHGRVLAVRARPDKGAPLLRPIDPFLRSGRLRACGSANFDYTDAQVRASAIKCTAAVGSPGNGFAALNPATARPFHVSLA